jgi:heavy metal sensor kinase
MTFRLVHVGTRLTLWYVGMLAVLLGAFIAVTAAVFSWQLREQLVTHAIQDLETVEGLLDVTPAGAVSMRDDYHNHLESRLVQERFLEVRSPGGEVLYRNDRLRDRGLGGPSFADEGADGYSPRADRLSDGVPVLLVSRRHSVNGRQMIIRVAYSVAPIAERVRDWAGAAVLALPIVLAIAGLVGYGLAQGALRPVETMARQADAMTGDDLNLRLPVSDTDDELAHLAKVFNRLLTRIEDSFHQLQRFTSDASHELRTPLAAIRSVGEVSLSRDATREEYRDVIGSMLEEVNRLTVLVENLLEISRADAGRVLFSPTVLSVGELVREATNLLEVLVDEKDQRLVVNDQSDTPVEGDRDFLRQALVNVVHNAVKYSPRAGLIQVDIRPSDGWTAVEVRDSGPGIPEEHLVRVFDRFYRVDDSRSREAGGVGLGLAIAKWAVEAHGGRIVVSSPPGGGATFRIELPIAAAVNPAGESRLAVSDS